MDSLLTRGIIPINSKNLLRISSTTQALLVAFDSINHFPLRLSVVHTSEGCLKKQFTGDLSSRIMHELPKDNLPLKEKC